MSRRVYLVITVVMASGFLYAARATATSYVAIVTSPFAADDSSSIDTFLRPAHINSAQLRGGVQTAGWRQAEEIVVLAADEAMSREEVYQVYYSAGYLLYPVKVRLSANPTNVTNPTNLVVFGGPNPFVHAQVGQLGPTTALVTLP